MTDNTTGNGIPQWLQQSLQQQNNPQAGVAGAANNIVRALMQGAMMHRPNQSSGLGTYEGNVATPANPFSSNDAGGSYGIQSAGAAGGAAPDATAAASAAAPAADMAFTEGAAATPFLDGSALFSAAPMLLM